MSRRRRKASGAAVPALLGPKRETLLMALRAGNRIPAAAAYAGVSSNAVNEWIRRGKGVDKSKPRIEPYITFVRDVEKAMAEAEVYAVQNVRRNMLRDGRMAVWWLENHHADWRQRSVDPPPQAALAPAAIQAQNVILVDAATIHEIATRQIRAERGEAEPDDAILARRARLVSESTT